MNSIRHLVCCAAILLTAATAFAQSPTSGALLSINGTVGTTTVNRYIYDSQIHTGQVRTVPLPDDPTFPGGNCGSGDQNYPTDAYVLQGGSWTGCDPGDAFETNLATGTATITDGANYTFTVTTQYQFGGCSTSGICANPDSGFLTVTNNGATFTGTITLSGKSPVSGGFCPATGQANDSYTNGLGNGASVVLALSTDSSNCGGFNADLPTQNLAQGVASIFRFGNDDYQVTPFNVAAGDTLKVRPVPVPAGPLTGGKYGFETVPALPSRFTAGTNFASQACIAYDDFSAAGNPVCPELQLTCSGGDCDTYLYTSQLDFSKDQHSLSTIGGVNFLGQHDVACPTTGFNLDVFLSYTPTNPDPIRSSGGGTGSCFVATYDPTATPVPVGSTSTQQTFVGFQSPVIDGSMNVIQAGSAVPLIWQTLDVSGNPVTNLTLCGNTTGSGCTAPWVFVGTIGVNCTTDAPTTTNPLPDMSAGSSGLQNQGGGLYQFNWKTVKGSTGCVTPVLIFSTGFISFDVAEFKYKK